MTLIFTGLLPLTSNLRKQLNQFFFTYYSVLCACSAVRSSISWWDYAEQVKNRKYLAECIDGLHHFLSARHRAAVLRTLLTVFHQDSAFWGGN